jgi:hypothetical protein
MHQQNTNIRRIDPRNTPCLTDRGRTEAVEVLAGFFGAQIIL